MALSESGLSAKGVQVAPITYGGQAKKAKGAAPSKSVRGGRKQSFYAKPRGRGRRR